MEPRIERPMDVKGSGSTNKIGAAGAVEYFFSKSPERYYLPTPPLGQDMTQGQFLSGV